MRRLVGLLVVIALCSIQCGQARTRYADPVQKPGFPAGERLYREGTLPSGSLLRAERAGGLIIEGREAACVNCHRRSGMGSSEGAIAIPPITGAVLYRAFPDDPQKEAAPARRGEAPARRPYDDATLARAIRDGIGQDGRPLSYLMPHFQLDDTSMANLITYLKGLSALREPSLSGDDTLSFATIVTPDADPNKRQAMLDVLRVMFAIDDPVAPAAVLPDALKSLGRSAGRTWLLHVWELTGPAETWEQQLRERFRKEPVFAVISGVGGRTWAPVQRFCEQQSVPCLLPNIDLPPAEAEGSYSTYFSAGVLLEARLLAKEIRVHAPAPQRIVQIFRKGDIGEDAASVLAAALKSAGLRVADRPVAATGQRALAAALEGTTSGDAVVLWLRPADLAALPADGPRGTLALVSGLMGGLEHAPLPAAWRKSSLLTYPFELPVPRGPRMDYPLGWFRIHQIAVRDERVQTDTYLACVILSDVLVGMHGYFNRDFLVEKLESMLDHRLVNGYYPHLGLAPGQRFASKGAYLVRFADLGGDTNLKDVSGWVVP